MKYIKETLKTMTSERCLAKNEEVNDTTKEIKKHKKKDITNSQPNKHKEKKIEEKGQLLTTRNK